MFDSLAVQSLFRNYEVHFSSDFTQPLKELVAQRAFFIIDAVIWDLYHEKLKDLIPETSFFIVEAAERNKSLDKCREIIEILVGKGVRRNEKLVAIGGGIVQDVTAFSASITYRGLEWCFFPTTLLAQADSCIGGKTSINLGDKKNLIGNFHPPARIYIDTAFLDTLSLDDIKSGVGEIIHYYIYAASNLFADLMSNYNRIIGDRYLLLKYIRESLQIKKTVIEKDEFDRGERNKFNYGHTFGHALESVTDYRIKHGQAVTVGMDMANYLSMEMGFMKPATFQDIRTELLINFPEYPWRTIDVDRYFHFLAKDKKNVGNNVGCILAKDHGLLFKEQLPANDQFRELIKDYFSGQFRTGK